ncbi:MAG: prepilin-type N-terminal cleavage/methylation domain-containing protein [Xanthomonadales bacterium]|jgi:general secretion pathway protein H|nr:prepilin-type N-terminal cleavage/methylation domain-containing protein [Xanthomonadales bacterium]
MNKARGFTLVEIIAVMALIALAMTLVAVTVGDGLSGARVKAASRDLVAALRYTRGQAIVNRESQALAIDVEGRRYRAPGKKWVELPKNMEMKLETARSEMEDDSTGRIRFFADGASTGGNVELSLGEVIWRIEVNWLTGEVVVIEPKDR